MKKVNKVLIAGGLLVATGIGVAACNDAAPVVSQNLSTAADNFEIQRRIVFYNGITDTYMLTIEGRCSITDQRTQLEVTCKEGEDEYAKHFLGLSDNVTYFAEQIGFADASEYNSRIVFRPQSIIPDIDLVVELDELVEDLAPDGAEPNN